MTMFSMFPVFFLHLLFHKVFSLLVSKCFAVQFPPTHAHTHNGQHATHTTTTTMPHTKHAFLSVNPASALKSECSDMRTCSRPLSCEWFEQEHMCQHPKGGEQCLNKAKSEENLVEARIDTHVCLCLCLCFFFFPCSARVSGSVCCLWCLCCVVLCGVVSVFNGVCLCFLYFTTLFSPCF